MKVEKKEILGTVINIATERHNDTGRLTTWGSSSVGIKLQPRRDAEGLELPDR